MMIDMKIKRYANVDELARSVANVVIESAQEAFKERGVFHWALAGGTSPQRCYEMLRDAPLDWSKVNVWFGDERCLPVGVEGRNDLMASEALLNHVVIPAANIHSMHAQWGAEEAAELYNERLATMDALDLVLLGMGEDGHTASLFPNNPALLSDDLAVAVYHSPKPPSDRVSIGYKTIKAARKRVMMVTGEGKRDVFERLCSGESYPISIDGSEWHTTL